MMRFRRLTGDLSAEELDKGAVTARKLVSNGFYPVPLEASLELVYEVVPARVEDHPERFDKRGAQAGMFTQAGHIPAQNNGPRMVAELIVETGPSTAGVNIDRGIRF